MAEAGYDAGVENLGRRSFFQRLINPLRVSPNQTNLPDYISEVLDTPIPYRTARVGVPLLFAMRYVLGRVLGFNPQTAYAQGPEERDPFGRGRLEDILLQKDVDSASLLIYTAPDLTDIEIKYDTGNSQGDPYREVNDGSRILIAEKREGGESWPVDITLTLRPYGRPAVDRRGARQFELHVGDELYDGVGEYNPETGTYTVTFNEVVLINGKVVTLWERTTYTRIRIPGFDPKAFVIGAPPLPAADESSESSDQQGRSATEIAVVPTPSQEEQSGGSSGGSSEDPPEDPPPPPPPGDVTGGGT